MKFLEILCKSVLMWWTPWDTNYNIKGLQSLGLSSCNHSEADTHTGKKKLLCGYLVETNYHWRYFYHVNWYIFILRQYVPNTHCSLTCLSKTTALRFCNLPSTLQIRLSKLTSRWEWNLVCWERWMHDIIILLRQVTDVPCDHSQKEENENEVIHTILALIPCKK